MVDDIEFVPTGGALGAEVLGVDAAKPLSAECVATLRSGLLSHSALLFRNQCLDDEAQVRFTRCFGEPEVHVRPTSGSRIPGIFVVSNVKENGEPIGALGDGEVGFHSDLAFMPKPGTISVLYALEVPETGGRTTWASGYASCEALDETTMAKLKGRRATHRHPHGPNNPKDVVDHPMIVSHPETGRHSLYITPFFTRRVLGLPEDESDALLKQLFSHVCEPRFSWTHTWQVGDMVMWDNRCTMHRREPFSPKARRIMHRTQAYNEWTPTA